MPFGEWQCYAYGWLRQPRAGLTDGKPLKGLGDGWGGRSATDMKPRWGCGPLSCPLQGMWLIAEIRRNGSETLFGLPLQTGRRPAYQNVSPRKQLLACLYKQADLKTLKARRLILACWRVRLKRLFAERHGKAWKGIKRYSQAGRKAGDMSRSRGEY